MRAKLWPLVILAALALAACKEDPVGDDGGAPDARVATDVGQDATVDAPTPDAPLLDLPGADSNMGWAGGPCFPNGTCHPGLICKITTCINISEGGIPTGDGPPKKPDASVKAPTWSVTPSSTTENLWSVWGSSATDVHVVGVKGTVLHFNGRRPSAVGAPWWKTQSLSTVEELTAVWGSSHYDVTIVGGAGSLRHYDGLSWSKVTHTNSQALWALWSHGAGAAFTVGAAGTVLRDSRSQTPSSWTALTSGTSQTMRDVWGFSGSDVVAVGDNGTILRYDGTTFAPMTSPTKETLNGVWGTGPSNMLAVGNNGTLLTYDGTSWKKINTPTAMNYHAVWGKGATFVVVVGDQGTVLQFTGLGWAQMPTGSTANLRDVWGAAITDLWAVGELGTILHFGPCHCKVGSRCYAAGQRGGTGCQICDPTKSTTALSTHSGDCHVAGVCYEKGEQDATGCKACDPTSSKTSLTARSTICKIGALCYDKGAVGDVFCNSCDPIASVGGWSLDKGHCLIGGACYKAGAKSPTAGTCATCQPTKSQQAWSPDPGYCTMGGACHKNGAAHPAGCATCNTAVSTTSWTLTNPATQCLQNDKCRALCGTACVDTTTDAAHCGACNTPCGSPSQCLAGKCLAPSSSCLAVLQAKPGSKSGVYQLVDGSSKYSVYCDMVSDGGGWTLVARFANSDSKNWIDSATWWYDRTTEAGSPTSRSVNSDAISRAFWTVKALELKISRTDISNDAHLLKTKTSCLGAKTFRDKIKSMGTYKTGAWSSDAVRGTCDADLGGSYSSTSGFKQANCAGDIGKAKSISFFADWSSGDGAVLMIGGGGNSCERADHGIGITEGNDAQFGNCSSGCSTRYDFGDASSYSTTYALNLFVR